MKFRLAAAILLLGAVNTQALHAQTPPFLIQDYEAPRTTREAREEFLARERAQMLERLAVPLEEAEEHWPNAFWTAALINQRFPEVRQALEEGLERYDELSETMQRAIMQAAQSLFPGEYSDEIRAALPHTTEPRAFVIGVQYVLRVEANDTERLRMAHMVGKQFPEWQKDGRLLMLWEHLTPRGLTAEHPSLMELLEHDFGGKPVIYSFQRFNRAVAGRAVIRRPDGTFQRRADGTVFSVPQIAFSKTNAPGTVTHGNAPAGVFTIVGTGTATNKFIGPTPYLHSKVPFEATVAEFFHDPAREGEEWTLETYLDVLPESWRPYARMHEAFYAGMAGRSEMIMHGTTINPDFYRGETFYPMTPSAGCITTFEAWSPETGLLMESGQIELLNAFHGAGDGTGYLVLVEIGGKGPVGEEVVRAFLDRLEGGK